MKLVPQSLTAGVLQLHRPLWQWHLPMLLAVPLSVWAWRRLRGDERRLVELGWVFAAVVVVGFTLPVQKSPHNHDQLLQYQTFDTMAFYGKVFGATTSNVSPKKR